MFSVLVGAAFVLTLCAWRPHSASLLGVKYALQKGRLSSLALVYAVIGM